MKFLIHLLLLFLLSFQLSAALYNLNHLDVDFCEGRLDYFGCSGVVQVQLGLLDDPVLLGRGGLLIDAFAPKSSR